MMRRTIEDFTNFYSDCLRLITLNFLNCLPPSDELNHLTEDLPVT